MTIKEEGILFKTGLLKKTPVDFFSWLQNLGKK